MNKYMVRNTSKGSPYRQAPQIVPQELIEKVFHCGSCGRAQKMRWLTELERPKQPIRDANGCGHSAHAKIPLRCSSKSCGHTTDIQVPKVPVEADWTLYGDEAARYFSTPRLKSSTAPLHFFSITLVGLHKDWREGVRSEILAAKRAIKPTEEPQSWSHHFTDIWGSHPESGAYELPNRVSKIEHGRTLSRIICAARPALATFTISSCIVTSHSKKERRRQIEWQKNEVFAQAILMTLQQMRLHNKAVSWVFDNVKDATSKNRTEGWAKECFLGLQYTPLFTWLSAGATIKEPSFVSPGSHFLLEIADFISYCVAREFEKASMGACTEFPTSWLGKGYYQATIGDGSVLYEWNTHFPLRRFYGRD